LSAAQFGSFSVSESQQEQPDLLVLGLAIGQLREQLGLSTSEVAAATGIERTRLQALEAGRLDPHYELLLTLADGLGVSPSALIVRAEELQAEA
jgi:transcriptional regulator with XRE-family HTH domain